MTTAERFLDLYKQLEEAIIVKYEREGRGTTGSVRDYLQDDEAKGFRERLDLMRQIRNLLSHNAMVEGETPVSPSEAITGELEEILNYVKRPPLAIERAVPYKRMLTARRDSNILKLMSEMKERGFSHVPVLGGGQVLGVFSASTVFSDMMNGGGKLDEYTTMQRYLDLIPAEKHIAEQYAFSHSDLTLRNAAALFERKAGERRVAAVLITEDGTARSKLVAMLTPWDLLTPIRKGRLRG